MTSQLSQEGRSSVSLDVAVIQHDIVRDERDVNLERLTPMVADAARSGARLVVLSEMFAIGFSRRTHTLGETLNGPTVSWMQAMASKHQITITGSLPLLTDGGKQSAVADEQPPAPTNSLLVVRPDASMHRYDKIYLFSLMGEDERFSAGKAPLVIDVDGLRVGLSVCYDLRFATLYWQRAAQVDVEVMVANWPSARQHHWDMLIQARAIENQTYVVAANRVGRAGSAVHLGGSRVIGPDGQTVAAAPGTEEQTIMGTVDAAVVSRARAAFGVLADRLDTDLGGLHLQP